MGYARVLSLVCFVLSVIASRAGAAQIYAETGFNDQSGINSNPTPGNPYALNQSIDGYANSEPGWTNSWTVLNGGALGGGPNAVVSPSSAYEGDGGLNVTQAILGSTEFYRDFNTRSDEFVVETEVNFGSIGEFDGLVIKDNYPLAVNVTGIQWRLTGAVGSRHFEVLTGNSTGVGTWVNTGIAQRPGQWQDVVADINVVTQTWTFSVDGVGFNQTMGFIGAPPQLNSLYYYDTAAGSVDSIIVRATPEPGTSLIIFAAGGLLLLRRRSAPSIRTC